MNNNIITVEYTAFIDLLPEIFTQIVEGEKERNYKSGDGTIIIKLANENGGYEPKIIHFGSWKHKDLCDKVRNFFKTVPFASLYNLKDNEEKALLKRVFNQILSGTIEETYPSEEKKVVQVKLQPHGYGFILIANKSEDPIIARIRKFIDIKNLADYYKLDPKV